MDFISNYFNYLKHSLCVPETYYRRYEADLPDGSEEISEQGVYVDLSRRAALSILPFVALYRPAGFALSVGMGSCRVVTHLTAAFFKQQAGEWSQAGGQLVLMSLAILSAASTVFNFGVVS